MGTASTYFNFFFLVGNILNGVRLLSFLLGLFEYVEINLEEILST